MYTEFIITVGHRTYYRVKPAVGRSLVRLYGLYGRPTQALYYSEHAMKILKPHLQ